MNKLLLDTKLLENKGNLSKIWGVPIKTKLSPKRKRELQMKDPKQFEELQAENEVIEQIIQATLHEERNSLTSVEQKTFKNRILGNWPINEANAKGIEYLVGIYYEKPEQKIIAIYEVSSSELLVDPKAVHKKRVKWANGQSIECITDFKNCKINKTIENLHRTFNTPQRLIFQ